MKTEPDLLVRDALAEVFVAAAKGDANAAAEVRALAAWRIATDPPAANAAHPDTAHPDTAEDASSRGVPNALDAADLARLHGIETEAGLPVFAPEGHLAPPYTALDRYVRDRAQRMAAALGWLADEAAVGDVVAGARVAWDAGLFFEVHELLEPSWLSAEEPRKTALQAMIMAGVALHHLTRDNLGGAETLLLRAADHLSRFPVLDGRDLSTFGRGLAKLAADIGAGRVTSASDVTDLPRP